MSWIVFTVVLVVLAVGSVFVAQKPVERQKRVAWITALWGAGVTLAALLFLPWLQFGGAGECASRYQQLVDFPLTGLLPQMVPATAEVLDYGAAVASNQPLTPVQQTLKLVCDNDTINGFQIGVAPMLSTTFRGMFVLLALAALLATPATWLENPLFAGMQALIAAGAFVLFLGNVSLIDSFGLEFPLEMRLIAVLGDSQPAAGMWWGLLGSFVLAVGGMGRVIMMLFEESQQGGK